MTDCPSPPYPEMANGPPHGAASCLHSVTRFSLMVLTSSQSVKGATPGRRESTFRLLVSSTFPSTWRSAGSDPNAERNALQGKVFPHLRELCRAHGTRFQAIDLRWGVSEEASLDQQTMRICLSEIARCQETTLRRS